MNSDSILTKDELKFVVDCMDNQIPANEILDKMERGKDPSVIRFVTLFVNKVDDLESRLKGSNLYP